MQVGEKGGGTKYQINIYDVESTGNDLRSKLQDVGFLGFGGFLFNTAKKLIENFACEGSVLIRV